VRTKLGYGLAIIGVLFVAGTTLVPLPGQRAAAAETPLWCLVCGEYGGVDVLNNIMLFLPFGLGLRLAGLPASRAVMVGSLLSLGIELLQLTVIPGRDASLSDVLTNSLGTWLGAMTGKHLARLLLPSPKEARLLAGTATVAWLSVLAATAVLFQPWAPEAIRGGAWGRVVPGRVPFSGKVTAAALSGRAIPDAVEPIPGLASVLREGDVELDVSLVSGRPEAAWSPVFEVLGPLGSVLSLDALGSDLAFHPPVQSSRLRLRRPALRLEDALPPYPGVPLRVSARFRGDTLSASRSIAEGRVLESLQVLGPSLGWTLITPFRYALGAEARWITGAWIAGWVAIIAYWSTATRARARALGPTLTLVMVSGLGLVPALFGYSPGHWTEWLASAAGAGIGYAGQHIATYLGQRCDSLSTREFC
jgi:hypothetical protein